MDAGPGITNALATPLNAGPFDFDIEGVDCKYPLIYLRMLKRQNMLK